MITCSRCGRENADDAWFCSSCGNALAATPPDSGVETRKTVSVMFMDAVGSTGLGEQTDPESLRRVMTRYFDEIQTIVERHGGTVEKYIGDAVMAVFGVPTVHEDDALRAVRAALEIKTRLTAVSGELQQLRGTSIEWRTGINTGEVVAGDAGAGQRFVSGDAVNAAARLEAAAQPSEILLGANTYQLVRDFAQVTEHEPISAKGKSEPLQAYRLEDLAPGAIAGGAVPSRHLESQMIGRLRQRRVLSEAFEQATDERVCHLFTILGAAGVGKSRLVSEFLGDLGEDAQVLHGTCLSYGEGITLWPIAEAVRDAAGLDEDDSEHSMRNKIGALIDSDADRSQVADRIGTVLGRFPTAGSTEETSWAVRVLLESLARRKPLVLVLDDIHWGEPALLDLIEYLAEWTNDAPLLLLCVARQDLLEVRPGWGGGLSHASTLTLEPLSDGESRELMVSLLGQVELGGELIDNIANTAEGNPLFVEQMIGMLIDNGFLMRRDDGGWAAAGNLTDVTVPPSIQALLAARLDRLPVQERAVIERGAVEGKVFHRNAVADLAPESLRDSVPTHLRALSRKELLRPDRSDFAGDEAFRFRHLLIRDAAYTGLPKEARAELHARFATWLQRMAGDHLTEYEEIVGYHLEQAHRYRTELGLLDDETARIGREAAQHLGASADRAALRGDARASLKLYRAALDLIPVGAHERYRLVAGLSEALKDSGDLREADSLLAPEMERALAAGDELGAAYVEVSGLSVLTYIGSVTIEYIIQRSEALLSLFEKHGDDWGVIHATLELAEHQFFAGHALVAQNLLMDLRSRYQGQGLPPQANVMALAALYFGPTPVGAAMEITRDFETSGSRATDAFVLRMKGGLLGLLGEYDLAREMLTRSTEMEIELGRIAAADGVPGHVLGPIETLAGNYGDAERMMLRAYERMSGRGDTGFSCTVAGNLGVLYVEIGRWDDAEKFARIALDTSQPDDVEAQVQGASSLARVQAARGDFAGAEANARRAVTLSEGTDYLWDNGNALVDLGEVLLASGRAEEAQEAMRGALTNFDAKGATALSDKTRKRLLEIGG